MRGSQRALLALAGVVILSLVGVLGYLLGAQGQTPSEDSADVGFARDMQTHHQQAVQMALIVRDRTDNEAIRSIGYDIATSQAQQSGQMYAWLEMWQIPQTGDGPAMAWMPMDHGEMTGDAAMTMMGMASAEQIKSLQAASGVEAERQFLTLMIAHHRGGVQMAEAALKEAKQPVVLSLATAIQRAQQAEITQLQQLLDALPAR